MIASLLAQDSLQRVINIPSRGIGNKTQALLLESCKAAGVAPLHGLLQLASDSTNTTMLDVMGIKKSSRQYKSLNVVADLFQALVRQRDQALSVQDLLNRIIETTKYFEYLTISSETAEEADGRIDNVQKLVDIAEKFDADKRTVVPTIASGAGMHLTDAEVRAELQSRGCCRAC
jgi:DNA helicase-2/ATP-dependent DNA helicase PcrA